MTLSHIHRRESWTLLIGDLVIFYVGLWLALLIRNGVIPTGEVLMVHSVPFTILFVVWVFVFYVAGLYEKHTTIFKSRVPDIVLKAQITNSVIGLLFFYLIPYFGITPKTILFLSLLVSFALIIVWRRYMARLFDSSVSESAILLGAGEEMQELIWEINKNTRYGIRIATSIDLDTIEKLDFKKDIADRITQERISTIIVDTRHTKMADLLSNLYTLIFSRVRLIDMHTLYEGMFDRVPLSLVRYRWFIENISVTRRFAYETLKRFMDVAIALPLLLVTLPLYPLVWVFMKLEDGGTLFYSDTRVGKSNKPIVITKFRSMTGIDSGDDVLESKLKVTRLGNFMRKSRIDELPQLWAVLRGDLSLIGPRPEFPVMVEKYEEEVPYYNVRHLIKPGLSGWAQIYHDEHPHHGLAVEKTKVKLSYDLYYLKNRSLLLDIKIALRTMQIVFSRAGI